MVLTPVNGQISHPASGIKYQNVTTAQIGLSLPESFNGNQSIGRPFSLPD
jgi:hypothetical protein